MPKVTEVEETTPETSVVPTKGKKKAKKGSTPSEAVHKEAVYPDLSGDFRVGDSALTADEAKTFLGWEIVPKGGGESLLVDKLDNQIRCNNNGNNRPFNQHWAETLAQEILRKRWQTNGETVIIGEYGSVLSGQHRLIGLVLAVQGWEADKDKYHEWADEPTMETMLAVGVKEDDATVNTIDTGRPRSLTDVIFRSEYFKGMSSTDRKACSRCCEHAVRLIWDRTGVADAFNLTRTHAEALDMLNRHLRLLECVKHIYTENVQSSISQVLSVGYAAAVCYLMATSDSDPQKYYEADVRDESLLDFSKLEDSQEFWINVAQGKFPALTSTLASMINAGGEGGITIRERLALIVNAWNCGSKVTTSGLALKYHTDDDGIKTLTSMPTVGGIDKGEIPDDVVILGDEEDESDDVAEHVKKKVSAKKVKPAKAEKRLPTDGDEVWVLPTRKGEVAWFGTLVSTKKGLDGKTVASVRFQKKNRNYDVAYESLSLEEPDAEDAA